MSIYPITARSFFFWEISSVSEICFLCGGGGMELVKERGWGGGAAVVVVRGIMRVGKGDGGV